MICDGVNDDPALAKATVGVSIGVASAAAAMETADVALMDSNILKLATVVRMGRLCVRTILQNVALSVLTKV
ncbi:unnamed protein product, partial [Discosporangium mesarthrocarpum]